MPRYFSIGALKNMFSFGPIFGSGPDFVSGPVLGLVWVRSKLFWIWSSLESGLGLIKIVWVRFGSGCDFSGQVKILWIRS